MKMFSAVFWHFLVRAVIPEEMTEKNICWKHKKQLGVFAVTPSGSRIWETLQHNQSSSAHPLSPFLHLFQVVLPIMWRKTGGNHSCFLRFYSPPNPAEVLKVNDVWEENCRGKGEQKSLSFSLCIVTLGWIDTFLLLALLPVVPLDGCVA